MRKLLILLFVFVGVQGYSQIVSWTVLRNRVVIIRGVDSLWIEPQATKDVVRSTNDTLDLKYAYFKVSQLSFDTTKMAFTAGYRTGIVGDNSVVFGGNTDAAPDGYNTASGWTSTAFGTATIASGDYSTAFGNQSVASGETSISFGSGSIASGLNSIAIGTSNKSSANYSISIGISNESKGLYSTSIGFWNISHDFSETNIGHYSTESTGDSSIFNLTNAAFKIGNGIDENNRSDCFKVDFNGNTTIAGNAIVEDSVKTNHIEPLTATGTLEIGHDVVIIRGAILFDGNLGNSALHPDTIFTTAQNINGVTTFSYEGTLLDDGTVLFPTNIEGHATISIFVADTVSAYAYVSFGKNGYIICGLSLNAVFTDTDNNELCVFDNGLGVAVRVRKAHASNIVITGYYRKP